MKELPKFSRQKEGYKAWKVRLVKGFKPNEIIEEMINVLAPDRKTAFEKAQKYWQEKGIIFEDEKNPRFVDVIVPAWAVSRKNIEKLEKFI